METLLIDINNNIATVTLNRPQNRNAVNLQMSKELATTFQELDNNSSVRAIILTGAGNVFCAGVDLNSIKAGERKAIYSIDGGFSGFIKNEYSKPVIAAVNGHAFAAGFEIILACDLVISTNRAKFGIPEVKRGLLAGAGGLIRLPKIVPNNIANELALTGNPISAERAYELGIVNKIVPHEEVYSHAIKLAKQIISNPSNAVDSSLRLVRSSALLNEQEVWELNDRLADEVYNHQNAKLGIDSFLNKTMPDWEE